MSATFLVLTPNHAATNAMLLVEQQQSSDALVTALFKKRSSCRDVYLGASTAHSTIATENWGSKQDRRSSSSSTTQHNTLMGKLVPYFADACIHHNDDDNADKIVDIDLDRLLTACHKMQKAIAAVGFSTSARDVAQNIRKIEAAREEYRQQQQSQQTHNRNDHRVTLRTLLEFEKARGKVKPGVQLLESSGAMGLLWIRRSMAFQCRFHELVIAHDDDTDSSKNAVDLALEAYRHTTEPYHSWKLQKVCQFAFRATTPSRTNLLKAYHGGDSSSTIHGQAEILQDLQALCHTWKPLLAHWQATFEELNMEDVHRV